MGGFVQKRRGEWKGCLSREYSWVQTVVLKPCMGQMNHDRILQYELIKSGFLIFVQTQKVLQKAEITWHSQQVGIKTRYHGGKLVFLMTKSVEGFLIMAQAWGLGLDVGYVQRMGHFVDSLPREVLPLFYLWVGVPCLESFAHTADSWDPSPLGRVPHGDRRLLHTADTHPSWMESLKVGGELKLVLTMVSTLWLHFDPI